MMSALSYEYHGLMAKTWDLFRGDTSEWEDRFFFLDVVKKYGGPALDVGCGTGRILLDFMKQGIDIDGVDNSPEMLEHCRDKADRMGLKPSVYQQAMDRLSLPRKYRTILVPSSSFQLLLEEALPPAAIRAFFDHLLQHGVLAMPFMTLWKAGDPLESEFTKEAVDPDDGLTYRRWSQTRFDPATRLEHTLDRYEVVREGRVIASEEHVQSPATLSYTQDQAMTLYRNAGFKDIQVFHEFTFEPVRPDDVLFCVVGFKP